MQRVDQQGSRIRLSVAVSIAAVVAIALAWTLPASAAADPHLTIEFAGAGSGEVECEVEGEAPEECATEYPEGTELMLLPEADPGSEFVEFSGDCGPILCFLTMDEDHTAVVVFEGEPGAEEFALEVVAAGTGSGTIQCEAESAPPAPCAAKYAEGTEVTVLAEADPGSEFEGFSGDCEGNECELTMDEAKSVTATFVAEPSEFALSIGKAGTGSGAVKCEAEEGLGSCAAKYAEGTEVTVLAEADPGFEFKGFSGDCTGLTCVLTMDKARNFTEKFHLHPVVKFKLQVKKAGTGTGTV